MEEIIKKLIAVDKAARQKVEAAEAKRDSLAAEMSLKKDDIMRKVQNEFSRQLSVNQAKAEKEAAGGFSAGALQQETARIIAEMDALKDEKGEYWVEEIVKRALS